MQSSAHVIVGIGLYPARPFREAFVFDIDAWCEEVLPAVRTISEFALRRYSAEENLHHYRKVARSLQEKFGDPALSQAGFLHGILTGDLRRATVASPEVLDILDTRLMLASLSGSESDVTHHLRASVLPEVREIRGDRKSVV